MKKTYALGTVGDREVIEGNIGVTHNCTTLASYRQG